MHRRDDRRQRQVPAPASCDQRLVPATRRRACARPRPSTTGTSISPAPCAVAIRNDHKIRWDGPMRARKRGWRAGQACRPEHDQDTVRRLRRSRSAVHVETEHRKRQQGRCHREEVPDGDGRQGERTPHSPAAPACRSKRRRAIPSRVQPVIAPEAHDRQPRPRMLARLSASPCTTADQADGKQNESVEQSPPSSRT